MVSAARATDPDTTAMTTCAVAVAVSPIRLTLTARMPMALDSNAVSTRSAASWLCGLRNGATRPLIPW